MFREKLLKFLENDARKSIKLPNGILLRKYRWGDFISVETRHFSIDTSFNKTSDLCESIMEKYSLS